MKHLFLLTQNPSRRHPRRQPVLLLVPPVEGRKVPDIVAPREGLVKDEHRYGGSGRPLAWPGGSVSEQSTTGVACLVYKYCMIQR